ncbi:MAG: S-layer homology domain-containing protein, partial [Carboxydocellales bacterium]
KDLEGHWAAKDVESLWAQDIISADASGLFYPDKKVTRAELVSMLVRALAHEEEKANSADVEGLGQVSFLRTSSTLPVINKPFFKDVLPGKWYFPYIQSAYQRKLVAGDQFNNYYPEQPITRQETAVILARALEPRLDKLISKQEGFTFKDRSAIADWASQSVYLVNSKGIIKGDKSGLFRPDEGTTKAELAVMVFNWLNNYRKVYIPILTYHHLSTEGSLEAGSAVIINPRTFTAQMQLLKDQGYHTITSQDLYDYLHKNLALPEKPVMITFDDGYESNYTLAYPILKKFGFKAIINIVVGFTPGETAGAANGGNSTAGVPFQRQEHLSWEQMREMVLSGLIEIQSHTYDSHRLVIAGNGMSQPSMTSERYLRSEGRMELWEEYVQRVYADLNKAKVTIEDKLGTKVTVLAYPYGAYNAATERIAQELGYLMTLSTRAGFVKSGDTGYLL